jgi:hypothetical protein
VSNLTGERTRGSIVSVVGIVLKGVRRFVLGSSPNSPASRGLTFWWLAEEPRLVMHGPLMKDIRSRQRTSEQTPDDIPCVTRVSDNETIEIVA